MGGGGAVASIVTMLPSPARAEKNAFFMSGLDKLLCLTYVIPVKARQGPRHGMVEAWHGREPDSVFITKIFSRIYSEGEDMGRYRKKPVVIEAVQFTGNFNEIEGFVGGDAEFRDGELVIATLEGPLRASDGDWIIKGVQGEFYPCKPDIFAKTYEAADEITPPVGT